MSMRSPSMQTTGGSTMPNEDQPQSLSDVLGRIVESTEGDMVRFEEIVQGLGSRSYGPLLLVTSLFELLPIVGAIPGMYIVVAAIVTVFSGQLLVLKSEPWLPRRLRDVKLSRQKLIRAIDVLLPWAERIDRIVAPRLTIFVRPPFVQVIAVICIVMVAAFFPFAFIPASEKLLALPVFFFALALTARDGLLALIGLAATVGTVWLPIAYWPELSQGVPSLW